RAPALVLAGAGRGAGGGTHCGLAARPRGLLALARSLTAAGHRRGGGGHRVVVAVGVVGVLGPGGLVGHGVVVSGTGLVGVGSGVRRDVVRRLGGTVGEPTLVVVGGTRRRVGGPAHSCFLTDSVRVGRSWRDLLGALDGPPPDPSAATADQALAGQEGLEPTTAGFGDRCATNCATALGRSPPPAARRPARAGQRAAWRRRPPGIECTCRARVGRTRPPRRALRGPWAAVGGPSRTARNRPHTSRYPMPRTVSIRWAPTFLRRYRT